MRTNAITRTNAIIAGVALIVGLAVGGVSGSWLERRNNDERTAAAVQEEGARAGRLEADVRQLRERADRVFHDVVGFVFCFSSASKRSR